MSRADKVAFAGKDGGETSCRRSGFNVKEGKKVLVFSNTLNLWVDANVVAVIKPDMVRVEYMVGAHQLGKTMSINSSHLILQERSSPDLQAIGMDSEKECDPELNICKVPNPGRCTYQNQQYGVGRTIHGYTVTCYHPNNEIGRRAFVREAPPTHIVRTHGNYSYSTPGPRTPFPDKDPEPTWDWR